MITKKDAIEVASEIVKDLKTMESREYMKGPDNHERYAAREMASRSINSLFFCLNEKTRAQFDYSAQNLFDAAGWR